MTEEELKAIENYKMFEDAIKQTISKGDKELYIDNLEAALRDTRILLNLIEKQQKENDFLRDALIAEKQINVRQFKIRKKYYISKDKIREKIEEYRTKGRYSYWEEIMALEGLLEE